MMKSLRHLQDTWTLKKAQYRGIPLQDMTKGRRPKHEHILQAEVLPEQKEIGVKKMEIRGDLGGATDRAESAFFKRKIKGAGKIDNSPGYLRVRPFAKASEAPPRVR